MKPPSSLFLKHAGVMTHVTGIIVDYRLVMTNIAMENHHAIKFGKPSISMGHLYHGYVGHNQRVSIKNHIQIFTLELLAPLRGLISPPFLGQSAFSGSLRSGGFRHLRAP